MEKKMEMQQGIYNVFLKQEFVRNMELLTTEDHCIREMVVASLITKVTAFRGGKLTI